MGGEQGRGRQTRLLTLLPTPFSCFSPYFSFSYFSCFSPYSSFSYFLPTPFSCFSYFSPYFSKRLLCSVRFQMSLRMLCFIGCITMFISLHFQLFLRCSALCGLSERMHSHTGCMSFTSQNLKDWIKRQNESEILHIKRNIAMNRKFGRHPNNLSIV